MFFCVFCGLRAGRRRFDPPRPVSPVLFLAAAALSTLGFWARARAGAAGAAVRYE
jgi:hypothetical protein